MAPRPHPPRPDLLFRVPDPAAYSRVARAWRRNLCLHDTDRRIVNRIVYDTATLAQYKSARCFNKYSEVLAVIDARVYEDALFLHFCGPTPLPLP
jgi:hypothetical protein